MSYLTGWYAVLGWQTSLVGTALAPAQLFQAVVILYNPSFASKGMFRQSRRSVPDEADGLFSTKDGSGR